MINPMCDGSGPCEMQERVRVLPLGSGGNLIVCRRCHAREIRWRVERNRDLAADCRYDLPKFDTLEIYGQ